MLDKWTKLYPHSKAHPTRKGKDIGEAAHLGEDLRGWLLSALPNDFERQDGLKSRRDFGAD